VADFHKRRLNASFKIQSDMNAARGLARHRRRDEAVKQRCGLVGFDFEFRMALHHGHKPG